MLIPVLDGRGLLSFPALYSIIALLGALSVVTTAGSYTIIADFVLPEDYNAANSLDVAQRQISFIAGPALAGLLVVVIGPISLLWVDSISFFVFALLLLFLLYNTPVTRAMKGEIQQSKRFFTELVQGVQFTFSNPLLFALTSVSFFWNAGLGLFLVALPFYCERVLKVGPVGMGLLLSVN